MAEKHPALCVVDSDVLIHLFRGSPQALKRLGELGGEWQMATTVYNAFELYRGAYAYGSPGELEQLEAFLESFVVLELSVDSARKAGLVAARLRREGRDLDEGDSVIAGITLVGGATLWTKNRRHFERIPELQLIEGP